MQWETIPVKNVNRKITMGRIHSSSESSMALEEEEKEVVYYSNNICSTKEFSFFWFLKSVKRSVTRIFKFLSGFPT